MVQPYYYAIAASNVSGEGNLSDEKSATPQQVNSKTGMKLNFSKRFKFSNG